MKNVFNPQDLQTVLSRIDAVEENSIKMWGKMNVQQMLCHCTDQLRMALGQIVVKDTSNFFSTTFLRFLVVYLIDAPKKKVKTLREIDQDYQGTKPTNFEKDKKQLIDKLNETVEKAQKENLNPHGIFGKLSKNQWGILIYKHLDHHLRQFGC